MLAARQISPLELVDEHISRIHLLDGHVNAFAHFDEERARQQARDLERVAPDGRPLYGLPMSVKASIAVAGYRCETGSLLNAGFVPNTDAVVVDRMRRAGAVVLGTTNCAEFLMAYVTDNVLYGRTHNPWDLERTSGGSSGGEAAAIAAGLSAGGLGSDGGGSVRVPAHFTGICALKPTPGRIPTMGHLPPCRGPFALLGVIGPMARTVEDLILFFGVLSGQHDSDPQAARILYQVPSLESVKRTKIGFFEDDGLAPVTRETRNALRAAVDSLRSQGFAVEPVRPHALEEARLLWWKLFVRCGAMLFDPVIRGREGELSPVFRNFLEISHAEAPLSGNELLETWVECDRVREQILEEMRAFPILLSPACSIPAFRFGESVWHIDGQRVDYLDAMRYTQWFNLLGAPAVVVPIGSSGEGLPIGVQIAGRPYEDELVLALAYQLERDFGYVPPPLQWLEPSRAAMP